MEKAKRKKKKAKSKTEAKYDEGVKLPKGFSIWRDVVNDGFSPISQKDIETLLELLKCKDD